MDPQGHKGGRSKPPEHEPPEHPDLTSSRRHIEDALGSMGKKLAANRRKQAGERPDRERLPRRELDKDY